MLIVYPEFILGAQFCSPLNKQCGNYICNRLHPCIQILRIYKSDFSVSLELWCNISAQHYFSIASGEGCQVSFGDGTDWFYIYASTRLIMCEIWGRNSISIFSALTRHFPPAYLNFRQFQLHFINLLIVHFKSRLPVFSRLHLPACSFASCNTWEFEHLFSTCQNLGPTLTPQPVT